MARFIRRGKVKVVACPAVANQAAPTRAEINAGTVLTTQMAETEGFQFTNEPIPVPDFSSTFDKQIPGIDTSDNPSITFWDDDASNTIRTALAKGTLVTIIRMPYGDVATKRCETFLCRSTGPNDDWDAGNAAQYQVGFAVEDAPNLNAVVPA